MSTRTAARLAWSLWALCLTFSGLSLLFTVLNWSTPIARAPQPLVLSALFFLLFLAFSTVGALISSRHPRNPIGWIFCALGVSGLLAGVGEGYALYTLLVQPGSLPGGEVMAWLATWLTGGNFISLFGFLFLLFPNGRLLSHRWRPVMWLSLIAVALVFVWSLKPGPIDNFTAATVTNPFGIAGAAPVLDVIGPMSFVLVLLTAVASVISLILRLRRARGEERQQIKWFAFAGATVASVLAAGPVIWSIPALGDTFWTALFLLGVSTIPISAGIAILKYRLYDIDIIIRRTLVYSVLTALLALVYFGSVVLLQQLFRALTGEALQTEGPTVISTLAIAALFAPLRRRVQNAIDRRFYRRKYDAAKTLAAFGATMRDEVDLNRLTDQLVAVVEETMQPESVSLWLKDFNAKTPRHGDAQEI